MPIEHHHHHRLGLFGGHQVVENMAQPDGKPFEVLLLQFQVQHCCRQLGDSLPPAKDPFGERTKSNVDDLVVRRVIAGQDAQLAERFQMGSADALNLAQSGLPLRA